MRTHIPKLMLLGVGSGIAAYMFGKRRPQTAVTTPPTASELFAPDPADPVQSMDALDQVDLSDLDVDALSMAEGTGEFASIEPEEGSLDEIEQSASDVGDLYGVHTPHALDTMHPDDDVAMNDGQNWVEALATSSVEYGPQPEETLASIVDDEDIFAAPHASDGNDTPVADRGSGGPAGI